MIILSSLRDYYAIWLNIPPPVNTDRSLCDNNTPNTFEAAVVVVSSFLSIWKKKGFRYQKIWSYLILLFSSYILYIIDG